MCYKICNYKQSFQYGIRVVRSSLAYISTNSLLGHDFVTTSTKNIQCKLFCSPITVMPCGVFFALGQPLCFLASVHFKPFLSSPAEAASEHLCSLATTALCGHFYCSLTLSEPLHSPSLCSSCWAL